MGKNRKNMRRISIHAAREGGDELAVITPLAFAISIHAAREGGDAIDIKYPAPSGKFQSTPPVKAATMFALF